MKRKGGWKKKEEEEGGWVDLEADWMDKLEKITDSRVGSLGILNNGAIINRKKRKEIRKENQVCWLGVSVFHRGLE